RIEGTVRDPIGAVVVNAAVRIVNKTNGNEWISRTDDAGHYVIALLPPGEYRVTVTNEGFANLTLDAVHVNITQTSIVDADLTVAGLQAAAVQVESFVQTNGPELGRVVESRMISELPLSTRNFTQIVGLSPGAATQLPDSTGVGRNTQTVSINGAR